jgi:hypothetical protein
MTETVEHYALSLLGRLTGYMNESMAFLLIAMYKTQSLTVETLEHELDKSSDATPRTEAEILRRGNI